MKDPFFSTDPAKVSLALSTLHMIAPFVLFNSCFAFWAFSRESLAKIFFKRLIEKNLPQLLSCRTFLDANSHGNSRKTHGLTGKLVWFSWSQSHQLAHNAHTLGQGTII